MSLGSRIRQARIAKHITQIELSDMLKISRPTMSNYENDKRIPSPKYIGLMIDLLDVDANFLYQDYFDAEEYLYTVEERSLILEYRNKTISEIQKIQMIGDMANASISKTLKYEFGFFKPYYPRPEDLRSPHHYAIRIQDEEMLNVIDFVVMVNNEALTPEFISSDILAFQKCLSGEEDDIVIFKYNGHFYLRKVEKDFLVPLNKKYKAFKYRDVTIIGRFMFKIPVQITAELPDGQ